MKPLKFAVNIEKDLWDAGIKQIWYDNNFSGCNWCIVFDGGIEAFMESVIHYIRFYT